MAIIYNERNKTFHLKTPLSSYIFGITGEGILEHLYWGKRTEDTENIREAAKGRPMALMVVDAEFLDAGEYRSSEAIQQEYAVYGSADLRKPAFHAQYADGSRITHFKYKGHKIYPGKPKLSGLPATYTEQDNEAETLEIVLFDELKGTELTLRYTAFENHDAIARSVTVTNKGKENISLKAVSSVMIDLPDTDFDMIHLHGAWARERWIERKSLINGGMSIESRRGASSHIHSPFFALARKNTDEEHGDIYGFSLVYSGNFEAGAEVDFAGNTRAYMGINPFDFSWLLKPGEELNAPEAVMVFSASGIGGMSRTFHKLYRMRLCRGKYRDTFRPILINNWEATYFDFNEEKILAIAKKAKEAGIELMVLDDGWFGKRDDDHTSLGDWFVDKRKLPGGIDSLAKKVEAMGMKFGLWFEPEMISKKSELYCAHPDWCLHVEGRGRSEGRQQLILDLSREDVCEYIISFLTEHLENAPISYVKWDYNRNMTEIGSALLPPERQAETAHRYMLGLYRILEEVTQKFPDVLFEGCSGGGGRFDAGMLYYFPQYWTSDDTDAIERLYIQHGTSLVMPASAMGAHVSAVPNHQLGRITPLSTRGAVAFGGQFGYELDITKMSDEETEEIKRQINEYKEIRETVQKGDMYRLLSPFEGDSCAWEYVSEDKKHIVLIYVLERKRPHWYAKRITLSGLAKDKKYRLKGTDKVYGGDYLENIGILQDEIGEYESRIYVFDEA